MHRSLGDDVGVESVAEVNGVDVVTMDERVSLSHSICPSTVRVPRM